MDNPSHPLPVGWFVHQNADGSYGIRGPIRETRAGSFRTSHSVYPSDKSDLGDLVRNLCQDAIHQANATKPVLEADLTLLAEVMIRMPELRRVSKAARQTGWHSPGLGEVHKDDTDHVIFEVDWSDTEVPLEDSVGDGKQEDADHAAAFNPITAGQLLDALSILFRLLSTNNAGLMLDVTSRVYAQLGHPPNDPCEGSAL